MVRHERQRLARSSGSYSLTAHAPTRIQLVKLRRGLKRIIGLAREEIAKAEFCRVFTHTQRSLGLFAVRLDFDGIKRISVAKVSPATIPQISPAKR